MKMDLMAMVNWVLTHKVVLLELYFAAVGLASVVIKLTPNVKDDHVLKQVLRFTGKYLALNRK